MNEITTFMHAQELVQLTQSDFKKKFHGKGNDGKGNFHGKESDGKSNVAGSRPTQAKYKKKGQGKQHGTSTTSSNIIMEGN
jgi:hypothetical protein